MARRELLHTKQQHVVAGANRRVSVNMSTPSGGRQYDDGSGTFVSLRIEDEMSGEPIVDLEMDGGTFFDLMVKGGTRHIDAWVLPDGRWERIGKEMEVQQFRVPKEVDRTIPLARPDAKTEAREAVMAWAREQDWFDQWEEHQPGHHNWGWSVTCRRWVDPTPATTSETA